MIIEFFGLSKTGKSILADELEKQNYRVVREDEANILQKLYFFLKYTIIHPLITIYLFTKLNTNHINLILSQQTKLRVFLMRNSYLAGVLSKYQRIKNNQQIQFTQELFLQSLFMILQKKSNKQQIKNITNKFPKSKYVFLFEKQKKTRHETYNKPHPVHNKPLMFPGAEINKKYAVKWMQIMEYNYEIIKQVFSEFYQEDKNKFKEIKLNLPKTYCLKHL